MCLVRSLPLCVEYVLARELDLCVDLARLPLLVHRHLPQTIWVPKPNTPSRQAAKQPSSQHANKPSRQAAKQPTRQQARQHARQHANTPFNVGWVAGRSILFARPHVLRAHTRRTRGGANEISRTPSPSRVYCTGRGTDSAFRMSLKSHTLAGACSLKGNQGRGGERGEGGHEGSGSGWPFGFADLAAATPGG